jgi:hypothetical protein
LLSFSELGQLASQFALEKRKTGLDLLELFLLLEVALALLLADVGPELDLLLL